MYNIAHIKNGVVENTCAWDTVPSSQDYVGGYELVNITDSPVGIGWEYAEGVFTDPNDLTRVWTVPAETPAE